MKKLSTAVSVLLLTSASPALAHLQLDSPTARYTSQKNGPCGANNDVRTNNVTTFEPGEQITVVWRETINHPSHYRISFDADGQDDFVDPATMMEFNSNAAVILDNIPDPGGRMEATITLPNIECDNCTLQIVQVMYDKPPYVPGTNDLYYQCADLILRASGGNDAGVADTGGFADVGPPLDGGVGNDTGSAPPGDVGFPIGDTGTLDTGTPGDAGTPDSGTDPEEGSGCSTVGGSASIWALIAFLPLLLLRRRRRQRTAG